MEGKDDLTSPGVVTATGTSQLREGKDYWMRPGVKQLPVLQFPSVRGGQEGEIEDERTRVVGSV